MLYPMINSLLREYMQDTIHACTNEHHHHHYSTLSNSLCYI